MAESRWIFGLSLDAKIEWSFRKAVLAESRPTQGDNKRISGAGPGKKWLLSKRSNDTISGEIPSEIRNRYADNFELRLRESLLSMADTIPQEIIESVSSIGVSFVGLADRHNLHLKDIGRREWGKPDKYPVVDFRSLFKGMFPKIDCQLKPSHLWINIHNETTAKCLAEWTEQTKKTERVSSLFYVMFDKGVNGSFVADGFPLSTQLHTELAHMWPRPHRLDARFDPLHSGCRIHKGCFEALASEIRIKSSWANGQEKHLSQLPRDPCWDVIAFYVAQMCMVGVLSFAPEKILLGGSILFEELLPDIREYFQRFSAGDTNERYPNYTHMMAEKFIDMATIPPNEASIAAALELGRLVLDDPERALKVPPSALYTIK